MNHQHQLLTQAEQENQERINLALYNFSKRNFAELNELIAERSPALEAQGVKGKVVLELWDMYDRILELRGKNEPK
jgi:hypothetical protein